MQKYDCDLQKIYATEGFDPSPVVNGRYLHWDEIRRRTPPAGLSQEDWWCSLKFERRAGRKIIPLRDVSSQHFSFAQVEPIPEILHEIDLGLAGKSDITHATSAKDVRKSYHVKSLIEEAITSSMLEDAVITRAEAKTILHENRKPKDKHEQMVVNNFLAMQQITALKGQPLSQSMIFDLHKTLVQDTLPRENASGRFRLPEEDIHVGDNYGERLHQPPDAATLPQRMTELCNFANDTTGAFLHPVLRAIILHFWLAYDHPFVDGNGRTARALFYWSMLRQGYWLAEFISISNILLKSPKKYYLAFLHTETDQNDLTYFIIHQLEVIRSALQELSDYIEERTQRVQSLEHRLEGMRHLNPRQQSLISYALRHPKSSLTIEAHRIKHNVSYQTARTDLFALADKNLLEYVKVGKRYRFYPKPDLESLLNNVPLPKYSKKN